MKSVTNAMLKTIYKFTLDLIRSHSAANYAIEQGDTSMDGMHAQWEVEFEKWRGKDNKLLVAADDSVRTAMRYLKDGDSNLALRYFENAAQIAM